MRYYSVFDADLEFDFDADLFFTKSIYLGSYTPSKFKTSKHWRAITPERILVKSCAVANPVANKVSNLNNNFNTRKLFFKWIREKNKGESSFAI